MKDNKGIFEEVAEPRKKIMKSIKRKDTSIEVMLRKALWHKGIRYRKNYKDLPGSPDIAITRYKIAVFCDGEFWHGKDWDTLQQRLRKGKRSEYWIKKIQSNINRDNQHDLELWAMEWRVVHFWEEDIRKHIEDCVATIQELIMEQRLNNYQDSPIDYNYCSDCVIKKYENTNDNI